MRITVALLNYSNFNVQAELLKAQAALDEISDLRTKYNIRVIDGVGDQLLNEIAPLIQIRLKGFNHQVEIDQRHIELKAKFEAFKEQFGK
ncbi:MAG: hypothetical protein SFU25_11660 [Candidatus Caenarcaniphilales bacterium]|nr:hypothetical protein [Candidatus Caenarcaniphilales bacterium]